MKSTITLFIILIICTSHLSAQKTKNAIYLKNGSIIYGSLIEISNNQYKVKGKDGSVYIFSSNEVDKYVKESSLFAGRKSEGAGFSMEAGLMLGSQNNEYVAPFSFNAVINYTIDTKNIMGAGTGAEFLGSTFMPLFAEYRRIITDNRVSPFVFLRGGMLVSLGGDSEESSTYYPQYYYRKDYSGGPSFTAGTGISWSGDDIETYLSFAYRYAMTSYVESEYNRQDVTYTTYWNRLEIKFGFKF
jgi:hypothetical protein